MVFWKKFGRCICHIVFRLKRYCWWWSYSIYFFLYFVICFLTQETFFLYKSFSTRKDVQQIIQYLQNTDFTLYHCHMVSLGILFSLASFSCHIHSCRFPLFLKTLRNLNNTDTIFYLIIIKFAIWFDSIWFNQLSLCSFKACKGMAYWLQRRYCKIKRTVTFERLVE